MANRNRTVYLKSAAVCLLALFIQASLSRMLERALPNATFRSATALSVFQVSATICMVAYLLARRAWSLYRANLREQIRPAFIDRVTALASEGESWSTRVPVHGIAREVLEECVGEALAGVRDSSRERLAQFACRHGFARDWEHESRSGSMERRKWAISRLGLIAGVNGVAAVEEGLQANEPMLRIEAARALLLTGDRERATQVFEDLLREPVLARALLTGDLKRYARSLLAGKIPAILQGRDTQCVRSCLEILNVWKLAAPGLSASYLLAQQNTAELLPLLIELLPYIEIEDSIEELLCEALLSAQPEAPCAAARVLGLLGFENAVPRLAPLLNGPKRLALAAAMALTQLGAEGLQQLRLAASSNNREAAEVAVEALEGSFITTHAIRATGGVA